MKLETTITGNAPAALIDVFRSHELVSIFHNVLRLCFDIEEPSDHQSEYLVQEPIMARSVGSIVGVEVRLTGVSRSNREPKVLHDALDILSVAVHKLVQQGLKYNLDRQVDVFVVFMLDGEIPSNPADSGDRSCAYSSVLESRVWRITHDHLAPAPR